MISAVVMVGGNGGESTGESWIQNARRKAACDLLFQLARVTALDQVILITPTLTGLENAPFSKHIRSSNGAVHVGKQLAEVVQQLEITKLFYFGGGSAPLIDDVILANLFAMMEATSEGIFTNNLHASDWAGITPASLVSQWQDRLPQDNMIGWVFSSEAGVEVHSLPARPGSRLDIDTPADLLVLQLHPGTKDYLRSFLGTLDLDTRALEAAVEVLKTPAANVFISGRMGPTVWQKLNEKTSCWIRVISEERGMVSSGRLQRREVYSFLADHISRVGFDHFFKKLADEAQAAFMDTRILMAHQGGWPSTSDRFASDLGAVSEIEDPWLREFTKASLKSPVPIIMGGHGLLSGGLLALCDLL